MKQKQLAIVALVCGVACAVLVALFMASVRGEAEAARADVLARYGGEQVEVCVATRDIVAGEKVDLSAVETRLWVADLLPEQALRSTSDVLGRVATSSIFKGEVLTEGRFDATYDALDVPRGKQAVSVPAKAVQAVGGAIRPGMSVDIYSSGDSTTTALASGVNVLDASISSTGSLTGGDGGWITLAIEPEKVQELIAASNKTTLYFTLPGSSLDDVGQDGDRADEEARAGESESADSAASGSASAQAGAQGASQAGAPSSNEPAQSAQPASPDQAPAANPDESTTGGDQE